MKLEIHRKRESLFAGDTAQAICHLIDIYAKILVAKGVKITYRSHVAILV